MSVIDRIKNINLFRSRDVLCVEVCQLNKELLYRHIQVKNQLGKVSIKSYDDSWTSFDACCVNVSRKHKIPFTANKPVCILVTGESVVIRSIDPNLKEESDAVLLQKVLPGAKIIDFIIQKDYIENQFYVSVCKKNYIEQIIADFLQNDLNIINVRMGPFDGLIFKEDLLKSNEANIGMYNIDWNTFSISNNKQSSVRLIELGDEKVSFGAVPMFGSVIYTSFWKYPENEQPEIIKSNIVEMKFWHYQIAFLRVSFLAIIFMIGTSYFLNRNYQNALIILQDTTAEQNNSYQLFEIKQSEYNSKIAILSSTGVNSSKNITQIGDRIGATRPSSIKLIEMNIFPLSKKIKKEKRIEIDKRIVTITGITKESNVLNDWIEILNAEVWTAEVTIVNFSQTDKQNPGLFELEILLNE